MESGKERNFSGRPYRSRAEAEADANVKMQELIEMWRIGRANDEAS
jgi:hypothetical protein